MREYHHASPVIADRIQQVFFEENISDREVAKELNIAITTVRQYRLGMTSPSIRFIRWLCSTYHLSLYWLLDMEKDNNEAEALVTQGYKRGVKETANTCIDLLKREAVITAMKKIRQIGEAQ